MMRHVIVEIYAKIENFKSISMLVFTQNPHLERVGVSSRDKKSTEVNLSCNISDKYFQQIAKKERRELNNTAHLRVPI